MNYEEWSKSIELHQTLTPNFAQAGSCRTEEKIFEQKDTKLTKGRESQETFGRSLVRRRETNRITPVGVDVSGNSNSIELRQTRTNSNTPQKRGNDGTKPMNYWEWPKSIELDQTLTPDFSQVGHAELKRRFLNRRTRRERR